MSAIRYQSLNNNKYKNIMTTTTNFEEQIIKSMFEFGLSMHQRGYQNEALQSYLEILKFQPNHFESIHLLGVLCVQNGNPKQGLKFFDQAIELRPDFSIAYSNRSRAYEDLNRLDHALDDCKKAISIDPKNTNFLRNCANIYRKSQKLDSALEYLNKALISDQTNISILNDIGVILFEKKDYEGAISIYNKIISLDQNFAPCYDNFGNVLSALDQLTEAIEKYNRAIKLDNQNHLYFLNRSHTFKKMDDFERALADCVAAESILPNDPQILWSKGLCLLTMGNFDQGWRAFESRNDILDKNLVNLGPSIPSDLKLSKCVEKSEIKNKDIFLVSEQGIGDQILFSSILHDLNRDAKSIKVQCDQRLNKILSRSFPKISFVSEISISEIVDNPNSVLMRLGSLGYTYRQNIQDFTDMPYLIVDQTKVETWKSATKRNRLRIGISWKGGVERTNRKGRSIELIDFAPIFELNNVDFISLQHGDVEKEINEINLRENLNIVNYNPLTLNDIDDLASLIQSLDIIISVDNTNVQIAGALGKPCFVIMPKYPEWRYGTDGSSMPWYSSIKLFRPKNYGDTKSIVHAIFQKIKDDFIALRDN